MLNSGLALFPRVGEANAPILSGNAMPKSSPNIQGTSAFTSFEDYVTRQYEARSFANTDTPGNPYALDVSNKITSRSDTQVSTFSQARIDLFDSSQQIISDRGAVKLANDLKLGITK